MEPVFEHGLLANSMARSTRNPVGGELSGAPGHRRYDHGPGTRENRSSQRTLYTKHKLYTLTIVLLRNAPPPRPSQRYRTVSFTLEHSTRSDGDRGTMLNAAPTQIGAQVVDAIAAIRALLGAFRRRVGRAADLERRGVARLRARSFEAHAPAAFPTERNTAEEQALLDAFGVFKSLFIHVKVGGKAAELAGELVSPRRQRSTGCCLRSTIGWEGTCVCACACGIMFFVCAYTFVYLPISKYVCLPFNRPTL